ncbi:M48 family metallopeptidase [Methylovirgula sp. 4M-Z18]|uniref:M48 family metallopeptidase n=1 Tax=Methylovirgula sp. 4M-Z18 TaxID=2293567 RepID=UPI000E2FA47F|nr:M48 family metallopeptidase [Methylovirgula sp. 4M-Z18]RFB75038.1 metalloendopeptidase [Methylovirgula sp. 4M-Z18]
MIEREQEASGVFYDGATSQRHLVALRLNEGLEIRAGDDLLALWPLSDLRQIEGTHSTMLRNARGPELARLEITDPAFAALVAAHSANLHTEDSHTWRVITRIIFWSLAATVSIILIVVFGLPLLADRLAPLIPVWAERQIGEAADKQVRLIFGHKLCAEPQGEAALQDLVGKLERQMHLDVPVRSAVLNSKVENAFALPGGKVYVLNGLLQDAQTPDELAGVIAHELGHVAHRDGLRRIIHDGGTSYLFGLLFGDMTGSSTMIFITQGLVEASYSRDAEAAADAYSIEAMKGLGRSPKAMGELLVRIMQGRDETTLAIFASHPLTADRLAAMAKAEAPVSGDELLNEAEWNALKAICDGAGKG